MPPIKLIDSTGHQQIDRTIRSLISRFEDVFPGRIRSYYLVGSYADGSATPLSDVDIRVIFRDDFRNGEEEQMLRVRDRCRSTSPIAIDCPPLSEARLLHDENWLHEPLGIKSQGQLLYGEEIRDSFPEPVFSAYVRNVTTVPVSRFARIRKKSCLLFPLTYPDPVGEFYGYDDRMGPAGAQAPCTNSLVHMVGFAATSLIALQAGRIVTRKRDWLKVYRETVNDEWTPLLQDMYMQCKQEWSYRIPENRIPRRQLREICRQILAFENDYLTCYRTYLLTELQTGCSRSQRFALERLKEIVYPDDEIRAALETIDLGEEVRPNK